MPASRGRISLVAACALLLGACAVPAATAPAPTASSSTSAAIPSSAAPSASTAPASREVVITAEGDLGQKPATAAVLSRIEADAPDLNVMLGDLSYGKNGEEGRWCAFVGEQMPTTTNLLAVGNHESNGRNGHIDAFVHCMPTPLPTVGTYPSRYYIDIPAEKPLVRVVILSASLDFGQGDVRYDKGTEGYAWTGQVIDQARQEGIPWLIVGNHRPCLSVGEYSCRLGQDLVNLLMSKKVDLTLHGHEHLYQRTKQLGLGKGCPELTIGRYNKACVADPDNDLTQGNGTVAVSVGTGGTTLRVIHGGDSEAQYFSALSGKNRSPTHGFLSLRITERQLVGTFVAAYTGNFSDSFTIVR